MPQGAAGFNIITRSHVEGHAAATMQTLNLTNGTLYLNNVPMRRGRGCDASVAADAWGGRQLRVVVPGEMNQVYVGVWR